MDKQIERLEELIADCNITYGQSAEQLDIYITALERLERLRLMRRIVENGIEIEGHMGGRTQIRIVAPE